MEIETRRKLGRQLENSIIKMQDSDMPNNQLLGNIRWIGVIEESGKSHIGWKALTSTIYACSAILGLTHEEIDKEIEFGRSVVRMQR